MVDFAKLNFTSQLNTFKNTGVYSTSITTPSSLGAGAEATTTSTVILDENQVFVFAKARYTEFSKGGPAVWQLIPTFDARVQVTTAPFIGPINYALYTTINGNVVTFTGYTRNPYGSAINLTPVNIPFTYVTYTVDK